MAATGQPDIIDVGAGETWHLAFEAKTLQDVILGTFLDNITVGSSISPEPPLEAWVEDLGNDNVTLSWCSSPDATDYVVTFDNGLLPKQSS